MNRRQLLKALGLVPFARAAHAWHTGGARSLDQELGVRLAGPGRFSSRVYGADYVPNQTVSPFSFLAARQATPVVYDPALAFDDLLGLAGPGAKVPATRAERLA